MATDPTSIQEQGFRSSFLGFDKNDVLAYMNTLADENQQRELDHQQELQKLQAQLDSMRKELTNARTHIDALQTELAAANQRADAAEQKRESEAQRAAALEQRAATYQTNQKESQKNANIWQLKCHDLQQQVETLQQQLQTRPVLPPAPHAADPVREAKLEARKILADARLYAESAERELKQQAEAQKTRMAENARGIAAGVMLLRDRLARVDARMNAAALDLDHATQSIYQALDETEDDLKALGTDMRAFAQGTPESDPPAQPDQPEPQAKQPTGASPRPALVPAKATVRPVQRSSAHAASAPAKPRHRLRSVRRPVSQLLAEQIDQLGNLDDPENPDGK